MFISHNRASKSFPPRAQGTAGSICNARTQSITLGDSYSKVKHSQDTYHSTSSSENSRVFQAVRRQLGCMQKVFERIFIALVPFLSFGVKWSK